jgi:GntR family transcriptional regulator / MocR family aminotransferase
MGSSWTSSSGVDLHLETDRTGRRSGLEQSLREAIQQRRLAAGDRLPSSRSLAAELGLSRGTVTAAYDQLVAEGYLVAQQGAGTRVAEVAFSATGPAGGSSTPAPRLDLRPGTPDVTTFPVIAWLRSPRRALAQASPDAFGYGDPRGRPELQAALSNYLGRTRGVRATPDQIVITSGFAQGLSLLCHSLALTGATSVAMEDPCLAYHRDVVRRSGASAVSLPVDAHGARSDLLKARDTAGIGAVVVTAAHQYPTGVTLQPARRRELTSWASATGGIVIEDDYDGEFRYDRQPVGALQGTAPDHVAYVGTTSKSLAPGLRLGWVVLPHRLIEPLVEAKRHADNGSDVVNQLALADLITTHGYDRHIRSMRLRYRRRRDLLLDHLDRAGAPTGSKPLGGIAAGLQALVALPDDGPTEDEVVDLAAAEGLALEGLGGCWHQQGRRPKGIIVGFATPPERSYASAVALLGRVLRRTMRSRAGESLR